MFSPVKIRFGQPPSVRPLTSLDLVEVSHEGHNLVESVQRVEIDCPAGGLVTVRLTMFADMDEADVAVLEAIRGNVLKSDHPS